MAGTVGSTAHARDRNARSGTVVISLHHATVDLGRVHRWPPDLISRATDIGGGWHSSGTVEIPVH